MTNMTPSPERARELAERCEAATGPDREIDAAICRTTKVCVEQPDGSWMRYLTDGYCHSMHPLNVTSSIDAALTLVPQDEFEEPWLWSIASGGHTTATAEVINADSVETFNGKGRTDALAICAAALRARAA
jgi:hypothetical protein